ncbi:MAG: T9SS type A sorting domain-containing protein [Saprospirales bacterium]|nr:T9SS type A sorting domain-containing protein [Saprospirales bacterium]
MEALFSVLLSLCLFFSLQAQDWSLVQPDRIGNYQLSDESLISAHIWVDSVQGSPSGDSLFFLNRVARLFYNWDEVDFGLTNQQQFLQRRVRKAPDGGFRFEGDSSAFVLFGGKSPGTDWLFDTVQQIDAQVLDQWEQTTFGVADSVQSLLLSTQDTILLSKTFGILRFPDRSQPGQYFELVGLDGTPYGEQVPKGPDFFLIQPGDVLYYFGGDYFGPDIGDGPRYKGRFVLEEKSMDNDTLVLLFSYTLREEVYSVNYETWEWKWRYSGTFSNSQIFRITPDHFSHFYKGQHVPVPANSQEFTFECTYYPYDSLLYGVVDYFPAEDGSLMKGIGHDPYTNGDQPLLALSAGGDSLVLPSKYGSADIWDYRVYYQQGPGLREWQGWCFEISGARILTGSIIAGDTLGQVYSEEFLFHTGVEESLLPDDLVRAFPNPANGEVWLEGPEDFPISEVLVYSPVGILVNRLSADHSRWVRLDLNGCPAGLYHLMLLDEKGNQMRAKVLKE